VTGGYPGLVSSCAGNPAGDPAAGVGFIISPLSIASLCFRSTSAFDGRPRFFWLVLVAGEDAIVDIGEPPLGFAGFGRRSRARVGVSAPDFLGRF
jgi:hypothetical protein